MWNKATPSVQSRSEQRINNLGLFYQYSPSKIKYNYILRLIEIKVLKDNFKQLYF